MLWSLQLILLLISVQVITAEDDCTLAFDTPDDYPNDDSGLRADSEPPLQLGESATYSCPGAKKYRKNSSSDEWFKTAEITCSAVEIYTYSHKKWPVCECEHDLRLTKCPKATYKTFYTDSYGETPTTTIKFPKPPSSEVELWGFVVEFDVDVRALHVRAKGADLWIKDANNLQLTQSENATVEENEEEVAEIVLTYSFPGNDLQQVRPHWAHPCIKSIDCTTVKDYSPDDANLWLIIGITTAIIVTIMIVAFICCYCCKNAGSRGQIETYD